MRRIKKSNVACILIMTLLLSCMAAGQGMISTAEETQPETDPAVVNPDNFSLNKNKLSIGFGKSSKLSVSGVASGSGCSVKWSTDNKKVAYVTSSGKVTGAGKGSAHIKAKVYKNSELLSEFSCPVKVKKKKVSYSKMKKKVRKKKSKSMDFKWTGSESKLALLGIFNAWGIVGWDYYSTGNEVISLYPTITAKKSGSSSKLSLVIRYQSNVSMHYRAKRNYKKMTISGGGKSIKLSGVRTYHRKRKDTSNLTRGYFFISKDTKTNYAKLEKLKKILSSSNAKIKLKGASTNKPKPGKTYTFKLGKDNSKKILSFIKKYQSLLKAYAG